MSKRKRAIFKGRLTKRELELSAGMDFVPAPGQGETKDQYISRCMGNEEMVDSFPDESQRAAVCETRWGKDMAREEEDEGFEVEIFASGFWNGMDFNEYDLRQIVNSYSELHSQGYLDAPLKLGHNDEQPMTDGQPALGWVDSVKLIGEKIVAVFKDVPQVVKEAIGKKLYNKVSVELDFGVTHGNTEYPLVLTGVALLGADIPAVNTLEDLSAFMSRTPQVPEGGKRLMFSANSQEESQSMMNAEEKARLEAAEREQAELKAKLEKAEKERAEFSKQKEELEAKDKQHQEEQRKLKFQADKKGFEDKLESMVKAGAITPAYREKVMAGWEDTDECVSRIKFAVESLEESLPAETRLKFNQQDTGKPKSSEELEDENDGRPGEQLLAKVQSVMNENSKLSFQAAKRQVFKAHPKLARAYILENGEVKD